MKLSEQVRLDFLSEDARRGTVHKVSYDYLIDLIKKIEALEADGGCQQMTINLRDIAWTKDKPRKDDPLAYDGCDPLLRLVVKLFKENKFMREQLAAQSETGAMIVKQMNPDWYELPGREDETEWINSGKVC